MSKNLYLQEMSDFLNESSHIALKYLDGSDPKVKDKTSVVTKADKAISRLAHYSLENILDDPEHILIDEESPERNVYLNEDLLKQTKYIWSVDPIDGTRLYAHRIPTFGISIGLLKDRKPWMGAVFFPLLRELFFCDGENSYFVKDAFTRHAVRTPIQKCDVKIDSQSILHVNEHYAKKPGFVFDDGHICVSACAVVDLLWPAIGRGCGAVFRASIWDFAGSWPVLKAAGLDLRHIETGKILNQLDLSAFDKEKEKWKLKDNYILSSERNFSVIQKKLGR